MQIKALLIPYRTRGNVSVVGSYRNRETDKELFLLSSGKKVVTSLEDTDRIFNYTFEEGQALTITLEDDDFSQKAVLDFWKNHPLVETDGYLNPNLVTAQFKFEIKSEKVRVEYEELLKKLTAVSKVSSMSYEEQMNLAFALGLDPRGMNEKEVYLKLIGLTLNGMAIAKKDEVFNYLTIRTVERMATDYAHKAIAYNIVTKEGSVYKIAGRNAGTTKDSVISLILSDSEMFENYIKPEVDKMDANSILKFETLNPLELPEEIKNLLPAAGAFEKKRAKREGNQ
jgi:hypothetical protein